MIRFALLEVGFTTPFFELRETSLVSRKAVKQAMFGSGIGIHLPRVLIVGHYQPVVCMTLSRLNH
jgi:hypothetical protein